MLHRTNRIVPATILAALLVAMLSSSAEAQFNRGQRGNFNVNPSPLLGELQRESVQKELGLTADQLTGIEEVRAAQVANPEDMAAAFDALRQAESDEERAAIQAEMQFIREEREAALRTELAGVLDEKQLTRLDQLLLHRTGLTALTQAPTAEKLGLTDEQQDEVADLLADRQTALRELGFGATADERTAVQQDFDSKVLEVLTARQQEQWTALLGPPPPAEPEPAVDDRFAQQRGNRGDRGDRGSRGDRGDSPFSPSPTPSVTASATQGPPVASFEPADPASAEKMSFAFRQAPWSEVLRDFALRAGLNLELIATPPGTFEYHDRNLYTPMEALDVINGALLQRGYLLVKRDQFLVCVNIDQGPPPNVIPYITAAELPNRGKNEMLTVVFPVKGITDVLGLADQVQQMLGPQGKSVGVQAAGALVVTDIGTNLNRVNEMLSAMSALAGPYDVKFQGYPLEHITAGEAETTLRSLLGMQFTVTNVSGGSRGGDDRRRGGGDWGNNSNQGNSGNSNNRNASPFDAELLAKTQFAADARTNQLLVTGPTIVHVLIEQAIQNIDVEATSALASTAGSTKPYLQIYTVRSSDAGEVAKTLDVLVPGVVVNEEGRNGRIHIMATAEKHREVEAYIRQLDGMGGGQTMAVIPLSKMDPLTAVSTLQSMFLSEGTNAPTVQADLVGRQVMIRGSSDQVAQIKTLLAQLGEDGTGSRRSGSGGNIRRFSLSGRDADSLLDVIDQAWHATQPNRIQVVPADRRSPIRSLMGPDDRTSIQDYIRDVPPRTQRRAEESNEGPISSRAQKPVTQFVGFVQEVEQEVEAANADAEPAGEPAVAADDAAEVAADDEAGPATGEPTAPAAQTAPAERTEPQPDPRGTEVAPGIFIQIQGDELVIVSEDEEALDKFEDLLSEALSAIPPQTTWTVFTLQTADATQAAAMLEQLIPDASVSQVATTDSSIFGSLSSSFSSMGSSLMSATGLSGTTSSVLRIIPEPRLNALFVSGPSAKVEEVADFLDILDASDWPGTLRDRVPRMIPVEYAEVSDVYRIVRDSYKDYIEGEQSNPFGGGNALAMFMGGGGGGNSRGGRDNNNRQQREIKLTVAMDEQTSHLIVSADEALYQEIKSLVDSLDRAALNARRTIRVVALQNTSTSAVQNTLGAVMPRVRVSTSGSRTSTSSSSSQSSSPTSSPSSSGSSQSQPGMSQDQMRQMWMQRMQQQGAPQPSGDTGRSRFGSGGSNFGGGGRSGRGGR